MKRNQFVALIGYDGNSAIVDRGFASEHGHKPTTELAALGFYKAALCSVIHSGDEADQRGLVEWLHSHDLFPEHDYEGLKLIFGVSQVEAVERVVKI